MARTTVLLDSIGITKPYSDRHQTTMATACTSIGREVEFWLKKLSIGDGVVLLQLHTSNLETPNPYGGCAIRYFPEVICTHKGLIVLRLRSPHKNFPTDYFVYGYSSSSDRHQPWVLRLPMIEPGIHSSSSVGVLRSAADDDNYVVANLRIQVNPQTWQVHAFIDRYSSKRKEWSQCQVALPDFSDEEKREEFLCRWQTDMAIPFRESLVWVDLLQGILLWPNKKLVDDCRDSTELLLEYVPLPAELLLARPAGDKRGRPQQFRNIGCTTNGEMKLVDLHHSTDHNSVEVAVWSLQEDMRSWRKEETGTISHPSIMADTKDSCDSLPPLFPALSTDKRDILYLTVVRENKACLHQYEMRSWTLKGMSSYPHFFGHRNPPYPSDLPFGHTNPPYPSDLPYLQNWTGHRRGRRCQELEMPEFLEDSIPALQTRHVNQISSNTSYAIPNQESLSTSAITKTSPFTSPQTRYGKPITANDSSRAGCTIT